MLPRLDSPTDLRQSIWHHLTRAPHDRHHPWRTPVLATTTPEGEPNARTVVLRAANAAQQTLTAFTDHRSTNPPIHLAPPDPRPPRPPPPLAHPRLGHHHP